LLVNEDELQQRHANWKPAPPHYERGFGALYAAHVTQADKGCDFDLLQAGPETPEPEIH
jgi:dihydroxy-acid dehydratase